MQKCIQIYREIQRKKSQIFIHKQYNLGGTNVNDNISLPSQTQRLQMPQDEAISIQIRSPEQEQTFKILQLKVNDSYRYIRQQFNKELENLKITKNIYLFCKLGKSLRHNLEWKHLVVNHLKIFVLLLKM